MTIFSSYKSVDSVCFSSLSLPLLRVFPPLCVSRIFYLVESTPSPRGGDSGLANTHQSDYRVNIVFRVLVARRVRPQFTHSTAHSGLGRACFMKVCALGSDLMWRQHVPMSNSWPSRFPSWNQPLLPDFPTVFRPQFKDEGNSSSVSFTTRKCPNLQSCRVL